MRGTAYQRPNVELIGNIADRMDSPHDGEALNATRLTVLKLGNMGLRIGDVVRSGLAPKAPVAARTEAFRPTPVSPLKPWQRDAWRVLGCSAFLSDYERTFLKSIKERRTAPTDKQAALLAGLVAQLASGGGN